MAEQHNLRPLARLADGVARAVDVAVEAKRPHLVDQEVRDLALLAGHAGDAQHLLEQGDRVEVGLGHCVLCVLNAEWRKWRK